MPPCSRICRFPFPGLVCYLPVAVEVEGGVVVGRCMIGHPRNVIEEEHVEVRPEQLPDAVLDENVDVNLIRKIFTQEAWLVVMDVVRQKRSKPVYVSKHCYHDLHEEPSIVCERCLSWHHLKCVGLKQAPKVKELVL